MEINDLECCAVSELAWISTLTPTDVIDSILGEFSDCDFPGAFIFTQAGRGTYGDRLADHIRKHKLGKVVVVPTFRNPNTGNSIKLFVWIIDLRRMRKLQDVYQNT
jgi:hypothetical protein